MISFLRKYGCYGIGRQPLSRQLKDKAPEPEKARKFY